MAKLTVEQDTYDVSDQGPYGRISTTTVGFRVAATLELSEGRLGILTTVWLPRDGIQDRNAASCARGWLAHAIKARLQGPGQLDYFSVIPFTADVDFACHCLDSQYAEVVTEEFEVSASQAERAQEALAHLEKIRIPFEAARKSIYENAFNCTPFGFKHTLAECTVLLSKIDSVLECTGEMYGSRSEHVRYAKRDYAELARRSVEANSSYQSHLTDLRRFASMLALPKVWARRPPPF